MAFLIGGVGVHKIVNSNSCYLSNYCQALIFRKHELHILLPDVNNFGIRGKASMKTLFHQIQLVSVVAWKSLYAYLSG